MPEIPIRRLPPGMSGYGDDDVPPRHFSRTSKAAMKKAAARTAAPVAGASAPAALAAPATPKAAAPAPAPKRSGRPTLWTHERVLVMHAFYIAHGMAAAEANYHTSAKWIFHLCKKFELPTWRQVQAAKAREGVAPRDVATEQEEVKQPGRLEPVTVDGLRNEGPHPRVDGSPVSGSPLSPAQRAEAEIPPRRSPSRAGDSDSRSLRERVIVHGQHEPQTQIGSINIPCPHGEHVVEITMVLRPAGLRRST